MAARRGRPAKKREPEKSATDLAYEAGTQYADEQLNGSFFNDWVWEQMVEAEKMRKSAPDSVISLESKRDYDRLARNMLQMLAHDIDRGLDHRDAVELAGSDDRETVDAFWDGLHDRLRNSDVIAWLADELIAPMHEEIKSKREPEPPEQTSLPGVRAREARRGPKAARSATPNELAVILAIANSEYQDAAKPEHLVGHDVWSEYIKDDPGVRALNLHGKALSAVFSSLQQKGLVQTGNAGPTGNLRGDTVALTAAGVALLPAGWPDNAGVSEARRGPTVRSGRYSALSTDEDMQWLRDVHLPGLDLRTYRSAILYGNEDYPTKIEVYASREPTIDERPVTYEPDVDGKYHVVGGRVSEVHRRPTVRAREARRLPMVRARRRPVVRSAAAVADKRHSRRVRESVPGAAAGLEWHRHKDSFVGLVDGERRFLLDPTADGDWILWAVSPKTGVQTRKIGRYPTAADGKGAARARR